MTRILIADDHEVVRSGLRKILEAQAGWEVVAEVGDGIDAITKALANELVGRKIRVNAIAPGMTETEGLAVMGIEGQMAKDIGSTLPMGRVGKPDDIARVAVFLASEESAWLTGERITASGGQR